MSKSSRSAISNTGAAARDKHATTNAAARAMIDAHTNSQRAKTERLKALRLEKEAQDAQDAAKAAKAEKKAKAPRKSRAKKPETAAEKS